MEGLGTFVVGHDEVSVGELPGVAPRPRAAPTRASGTAESSHPPPLPPCHRGKQWSLDPDNK